MVGSRMFGQANSLQEPASHAPAPSGPMSSYGNIPEALCPPLPGQSEALLSLRVQMGASGQLHPGAAPPSPPHPRASFSPSPELSLTPQETLWALG